MSEGEVAAPAFLAELAIRLGADRVMDAARAQTRYGADTAGTTRSIAGAILPRDADQVRQLVLAAQRFGVPLYPISTGNNWGYGTANPARNGCVIVDLSGMRAIDIDAETGVVSVEPGVTQAMLRAYLDQHAPDFLCPVTGAGPDCSLVGNALERGYGITPYADHFAAVVGIEAVLPNGDLYRPPLAEMGAENIDKVFKWSVGPYLDGLFAQGNFGIVTRMHIALATRPERVEAFFFGVPQDVGLEDVVLAVRGILRELGGVVGSINLMNRHRVLAMMEPYPRDRLVDGLIPEDCLQEMARRNQVMAWMGAGALYGNAKLVAAARTVIRQRLGNKVRRLMFFTEGKLNALIPVVRALPGKPFRNLDNVLATLHKTLKLLGGAPSEIALPLAYWISGQRPPAGQPMNPSRDGCGLIWYSPLIEMKPQAVRDYVEMVKRACTHARQQHDQTYRFEPLITLTTVSDRCIDSTVPILFKRTDPHAVMAARECYKDLFEAGLKLPHPCVPYRGTVDSISRFMASGSPFWKTLNQIKTSLDPQQILAPGRYTRSEGNTSSSE